MTFVTSDPSKIGLVVIQTWDSLAPHISSYWSQRMEANHPGFGDSLHRPIVSADGHYLASISPGCCLRLLCLGDDGSVWELANAPLPKALNELITRLSVFRWGPILNGVSHTSENGDANILMPLLLLSDGIRLVVVNPNKIATNSNEPVAKHWTNAGYVVADYQLGDQFGKLLHASFVLDADHVLVLFEMGAHASIISLTRPQRDDLPNVKFNSDRAIAVSSDGRNLAMLLRSKGQDQVTLLGLKEENVQIQATFNTHTNDAQGLVWSPDEDPVIAVHESPAYGPRVLFFSALGHPLKQLEISAFNCVSNISGLGITNLRWVAAESGTMLAVADGEKRVLVRRQHNRMMSVQRLALLVHRNVIDGLNSIVWQQTGDTEHAFALQKGAFDATVDHKADGSIDLLEFDCSQKFIATVVAKNPKAVWLWQPDHPEPHTIILFQESVQQLLWHPTRSGILAVIVSQRSPVVYVWYSETKAPSPLRIPLYTVDSTKYQGCWLRRSIHGRHPFVLSSTKSIELGMVEEHEGSVVFASLLRDTLAASQNDEGEDTTGEISTPSKPSKEGAQKGNLQIMQDFSTRPPRPADASRW